jgi:HD-like signal output (HDOD) protein
MILARLERMLADHDSLLEDVTAVLKCDAALAARILRIANSTFYGAGEPCDSLEEAVLRVGFKELYRLTGFAATTQIADRYLGLYGVTAAQFRENALLTALVMEQLAERAEVDPAAAYTVGLLRSIGKIALDRWVCSPTCERSYEPSQDGPLVEWESTLVGLTNSEAAEMILGEWLFPTSAIEAIRHHYVPAETSRMASLLNLAAGAAERCGHGWPGERFYWQVSPERFAAAGVDADELDHATRDALEAFGPVRIAVG